MAAPQDINATKGSLKRLTVRGGATTLVAQGLKFVIRIGSQIAIARFLIPSDYGLIAMVAPVLALVQLVADLGLGQAIVQQSHIRQKEISTLFWFGFGINFVMLFVVVGISPLLAWMYHEPRLVGISLVLASLIPISGLATQPKALLNRDLRLSFLAMLDVVPPGIGLLVGFAAASSGWGYWSLVMGAVSETLMGTVLIWILSPWRPTWHFDVGEIRALLHVGGNITGYNLAQYCTTVADNVLLAVSQGPSALGLYDKGYKTITQPLTFLLAPSGRIAIPVLVRVLDRPDRYRDIYFSMLEAVIVLATPGIAYVMVMAKPLMLLLLGPTWTGVAPIMSWLGIGCLASSIYNGMFWLFVSQGRSTQQLHFALFTSLISVAGFAAGLPWGPTGVAAGAGLSFVIATTLTCWGATRSGPVRGTDLIRNLLPTLVALPVTVLALFFTASAFEKNDTAMLLLSSVVTYPVFCLSLFCLPGGRGTLRRLWDLKSHLIPASWQEGGTTKAPAL